MRCYDSHTPILFFSGAGREADKKMGHQAGANAYVIKPDVRNLLGSIASSFPVLKAQQASQRENFKRRASEQNTWRFTPTSVGN
jgi:DNA-binding response OmpR family regulator